MNTPESIERLNIVLAGHVDHGKSTIVGRLLADAGALPEGKLEQIKAYCRRNAKPFEYAFLVDALKNEQAQGVTIDSARVFFRTGNREYVLIDAPGHMEFIRNMVTGAARADAALLVVDAQEGIQENSRRHCALLAMLGIRQITVLVNKMDLVVYRQNDFEAIKTQLTEFLERWSLKPNQFIPVSGLNGENIVQRGASMPWYNGWTVLDCLTAFQPTKSPVSKQFRMWIQDIYKFTNDGDMRRIVAGTIESGSLQVGDHIMFLPSGKKSSVKSIEQFSAPPRTTVYASEAVGFTLTEQIYVSRGELVAKTEEFRPHISSRFRASLFWLGREPMIVGREYLLKIGTSKTSCLLEAIHNVQDGASLELKEGISIGRHEIADCNIQMSKALAFDCIDEVPASGRFVIVDDYEIRGGGIIREALEDKQSHMRERVLLRDYKWETSAISSEERALRFRQKPAMIILTGKKDSGKKPVAKALEKRLLDDEHFAYFLGIGNVLYGVDADIKGKINSREEHLRRLGEVAHLLLNSGAILIVTAIELAKEEIDVLSTLASPDGILTVWVGKDFPTDIRFDCVLDSSAPMERTIQSLMKIMQDKGTIGA
jgi:bifunctional enzyme CysN/CysC